jgi:hypothetical protein
VTDFFSDREALLRTVGVTATYAQARAAAKSDRRLYLVLAQVETVLTAREHLVQAVDHLIHNLARTRQLLDGTLSYADKMAQAASDHDTALVQLRAAVDTLERLATVYTLHTLYTQA